MTYRRGAVLYDTKTGRVGVLASNGETGELLLRPLGGGKEWAVRSLSLRLATNEDIAKSGSTA